MGLRETMDYNFAATVNSLKAASPLFSLRMPLYIKLLEGLSETQFWGI